jgi:hypothetical protein
LITLFAHCEQGILDSGLEVQGGKEFNEVVFQWALQPQFPVSCASQKFGGAQFHATAGQIGIRARLSKCAKLGDPRVLGAEMFEVQRFHMERPLYLPEEVEQSEQQV